MRTFDYRNLPNNLLDGKIATATMRLYEDKGELSALRLARTSMLNSMQAQAHLDNVDASLRIEGLYVDRLRLHELIEGTAPANETEAQAVGYSNALRLIEDHGDDLDISTSTVLEFYETLYAHRNLGMKSRYRKKDFMYVNVEGRPQAMPVSPINAFETPLVLGAACDSLTEAFKAADCSLLILTAVFTVDFMCIRPFDEGNGRIARLLANLLLAKAGLDVARYHSVDRLIEQSGMGYYNALNACVEGWDRGANDYAPYVLYWLEILHTTCRQLLDSSGLHSAGGGAKSRRVRQFIEYANKPIAKRDLRVSLPDISEATIENELGNLVKKGLVEKVGAGRSTAYKWIS